MSSRNGDKSRFGRQRKQKLARRVVLRKLQAGAKVANPVESGAVAPVTAEESEPEGSPVETNEGVLTGAARLVGSALGVLAAGTHLAGPAAHAEE